MLNGIGIVGVANSASGLDRCPFERPFFEASQPEFSSPAFHQSWSRLPQLFFGFEETAPGGWHTEISRHKNSRCN